ncbi:MAG: hypothetical protein K0S32_3027 [Bacteroidetes bacterium]|jgi:hypothetical protein|nr:hypothetical protein [Bacteroidota bacterium]
MPGENISNINGNNDMVQTKTVTEIRLRIREIEDKLQTIEELSQKELKKPFFRRDYYTFHFINLERKSYTRSLNELKWVLNE